MRFEKDYLLYEHHRIALLTIGQPYNRLERICCSCRYFRRRRASRRLVGRWPTEVDIENEADKVCTNECARTSGLGGADQPGYMRTTSSNIITAKSSKLGTLMARLTNISRVGTQYRSRILGGEFSRPLLTTDQLVCPRTLGRLLAPLLLPSTASSISFCDVFFLA